MNFAIKVKRSPADAIPLRSGVMQILCLVVITVGEPFAHVRFGTLFGCVALLP